MASAKKALILAGGGMKVGFQAGVLEVWLDEARLAFDHADGASGGCFNLAMYCQGMSGKQIADNWRNLDPFLPVDLNFEHYWRLAHVPALFTYDNWPPEITCGELHPYYERVGAMLDVRKVPYEQWPERTRLVKEAARKKGWSDRFEPLDLAVTFDPEWRYDLPDAHDVARSKTFTNVHGQQQGTCVHLGNCDIGCDVQAKNTLDVNYLAMAERHGAQIRPFHLVRHIAPETGGYRVAGISKDDRRDRPDARAAGTGDRRSATRAAHVDGRP